MAKGIKEIIILENKCRKIIHIIDEVNNRMKYIKEYPDGTREDVIAPYPANDDEYIWHPIDEGKAWKKEPYTDIQKQLICNHRW